MAYNGGKIEEDEKAAADVLLIGSLVDERWQQFISGATVMAVGGGLQQLVAGVKVQIYFDISCLEIIQK